MVSQVWVIEAIPARMGLMVPRRQLHVPAPSAAGDQPANREMLTHVLNVASLGEPQKAKAL